MISQFAGLRYHRYAKRSDDIATLRVAICWQHDLWLSEFDPISLVWTVININLAYVLIELSPFKTILRKFSYGILLTCSLLDIMLCSFTLWANLTEEVTPLSCRLTEKIRNISKRSNLCLSIKSDIKGWTYGETKCIPEHPPIQILTNQCLTHYL